MGNALKIGSTGQMNSTDKSRLNYIYNMCNAGLVQPLNLYNYVDYMTWDQFKQVIDNQLSYWCFVGNEVVLNRASTTNADYAKTARYFVADLNHIDRYGTTKNDSVYPSGTYKATAPYWDLIAVDIVTIMENHNVYASSKARTWINEYLPKSYTCFNYMYHMEVEYSKRTNSKKYEYLYDAGKLLSAYEIGNMTSSTYQYKKEGNPYPIFVQRQINARGATSKNANGTTTTKYGIYYGGRWWLRSGISWSTTNDETGETTTTHGNSFMNNAYGAISRASSGNWYGIRPCIRLGRRLITPIG